MCCNVNQCMLILSSSKVVITIMEKLYTIKELALIFNVHKMTVNRWIVSGQIKASKVGRSWQVKESEVKHVTENGLRTKEGE